MEWIFDNFQLVLGIIIIAGYILRGVMGSRIAESEHEGGSTQPPVEEESDEAERTRQIQDEIRRRILERQRGEQPARTSQPATVKLDPVQRRQPTPPPIRQTAVVRADPLSDSTSQRILERQRELEEKMKLLRQARDEGSNRAPKVPSRSWAQKLERKRTPTVASGRLRDDLYRPDSLRRAFVLREVLGRPLGFEMGPPDLPRR